MNNLTLIKTEDMYIGCWPKGDHVCYINDIHNYMCLSLRQYGEWGQCRVINRPIVVYEFTPLTLTVLTVCVNSVTPTLYTKINKCIRKSLSSGNVTKATHVAVETVQTERMQICTSRYLEI